ncbi:WD40-repeat-containing domain protein [Tribonema minus]|uniref:WD40-repeat-containing domain protein n=1 Tax=Tribonema minus TaxID=303371 RepID=A0A835Z1J7_9STRA|nr:WD40-repeat-containing domain protein [Tribonema minus]
MEVQSHQKLGSDDVSKPTATESCDGSMTSAGSSAPATPTELDIVYAGQQQGPESRESVEEAEESGNEYEDAYGEDEEAAALESAAIGEELDALDAEFGASSGGDGEEGADSELAPGSDDAEETVSVMLTLEEEQEAGRQVGGAKPVDASEQPASQETETTAAESTMAHPQRPSSIPVTPAGIIVPPKVTPVHVLSKKGKATELAYGQAMPKVDIAKARGKLINMRKMLRYEHPLAHRRVSRISPRNRHTHPRREQAATNSKRACAKMERSSKNTTRGLGALNMDMVNRHRPDFADLVRFQTVDAHEGAIWCLEFSQNGRLVATGGADGVIKVWKVSAALERPGVTASSNPNTPAPWTADAPPSEGAPAGLEGWTAAAAATPIAADGVPLEPWELKRAKALRAAANPPPPPLRCTDQLLRGRPAVELRGHTADVTAVAWMCDGRLLSASLDGTVRVWRLPASNKSTAPTVVVTATTDPVAVASPDAPRCERVFAAADGVACAAAHPSRATFAVAGLLDGRVCVWNTDTGALAYCKRAPAPVTALAFSGDGTTVVVGLGSGTVQVRDRRTMALRHAVDVRTSKTEGGAAVTGFAFRRTNNHMVVGTRTSKARVLEALDFKGNRGAVLCDATELRRSAKLKGATVSGLPIKPSYSEDDRFIISGSEDGRVFIWDCNADGAELGHERWLLDPAGAAAATCARFVPAASVQRCVDQVAAARRGAADAEALDAAAADAAAAAAAEAAAAAAPPAARSSALRSNPIAKASKAAASSGADGVAVVAAAAGAAAARTVPEGGSSGLQRAVVHGRAQAGAQKLRQIGAINAQNMVSGAAAQPSLRCQQRELREGPGVGGRRAEGRDTPAGALLVEQGRRSSAGRLQGYRNMMAPGGSELPKNPMVIAADASGRIHVFCRAALAEEWIAARDA